MAGQLPRWGEGGYVRPHPEELLLGHLLNRVCPFVGNHLRSHASVNWHRWLHGPSALEDEPLLGQLPHVGMQRSQSCCSIEHRRGRPVGPGRSANEAAKSDPTPGLKCWCRAIWGCLRHPRRACVDVVPPNRGRSCHLVKDCLNRRTRAADPVEHRPGRRRGARSDGPQGPARSRRHERSAARRR